MKKLTYLLFALFVLFPTIGFCVGDDEDAEKNGIITGRIIDSENFPLPGATVYISSINKGTVTNVDGYYTIVGIDAGEYLVQVSYVGYKKIEKNVTVTDGGSVSLDFQLSENEILDEVVVKGNAGGVLKALNQQLTAPSIMNVISSDQVGSFPDPNIGDALKRIPGIHVQYDQGEAKLISIRGTDPSKSTISINGAAMPGTGNDRAVGVDAIPADMVQAIEVSKAITPDMDGDAIGGAVNLVTRKAPYSKRLSISGATGYSALTQKPQFNGNIIFGDRYFNNKFGVIGSASIYEQKLGSNRHNSSWETTMVGTDEYFVPKYLNIEQTLMERLRQSYTLGLDFKFNQKHSIAFTGIFNDYKDWRETYTLRIDDIGGGYKGNWKMKDDYSGIKWFEQVFDDPEDFADEIDGDIDADGDGVNDSTGEVYIVLDENNDGIDDNTGNMYVDYDPLHPSFHPELERHVLAGGNDKGGDLTHKKIFNWAFEGDHVFGALKFDWDFAYVKSIENQPDSRDFELQSYNEKTVLMDFSNPRYLGLDKGFGIDNVAQEIAGRTSADIDENRVDTWELDGFKGKDSRSNVDQFLYSANFELPLIDGKFENKIKFGAKAKTMSKSKKLLGRVKWKPAQNDPESPETFNWGWMWNEFAQNMEDVSSNFNNSNYNVGQSVTAQWVGSQVTDFNNTTDHWMVNNGYNKEIADGYTASEDVYAAYLMSTQKFGEKLSLMGGLRVEQTKIDYHGWEYFERAEVFEEVSASQNYTTLLPGVHLKYMPTKRSVFRLAYTKTISRPNYRDIVPYVKCDIKDDEIEFGNPDIKPTLAHNFDLLGEYYIGSTGLISAGLYYKNIKDFETTMMEVLPWEDVVQYVPSPEQISARTDITEDQKEDYIKRYNKAEGHDFESFTPGNGGDANLIGIELAFQKRLDFLPGFLRNFSVYTNYTHNWVDNKDKEHQLSGTAEDIINASLAYDNKRLSARVSYNYTSDFLTSNGSTEFTNVYYDKVSYLDANIDIFISKKIVLFASANNLLNEIQRTYQWKPQYTYSALENGARFQVGLKLNIY
ncbi:TonB-dependent receptor [Mariniphaga anaerophila]|uniref:TonB-dependent receptor n=1 Tax=Mariniphaga anaerophila TaxID=1484053 RepID=A0A1M4VSN9_9BACT|nr:TonB-dependent receptor [Mariniphaga anaerophila]SHE71832.1 TonB-dependent receptor [Mariniphaga anaerophila]